MTWFKVDDKFWSHRKTRSLTDAAVAQRIVQGFGAAGMKTTKFVHLPGENVERDW